MDLVDLIALDEILLYYTVEKVDLTNSCSLSGHIKYCHELVTKHGERYISTIFWQLFTVTDMHITRLPLPSPNHIASWTSKS
jgi:hypothetical protein